MSMNQIHLPFHLIWKFLFYLQIADEYIATTSYVNSFGQECINILIAQESNSTRGSSPPAVDVTTMYNKICPAQCSDQGTCKNATCFCNAGIEFIIICSSVSSIELQFNCC